ncbi:hypothetical protein L218DRAFT_963613 [Marasmius fiardii PR-910]|nr:hypothetical protein L218DRAFT_963613 [Marasmius fiardii PR-910]
MESEPPSGPSSPQHKRIKLESASPEPSTGEDIPEDLEENQCCICLQALVDRTVVPPCSHEFCFECLMIWTEQSRRCPLCSQDIGEYVIHNIRSRYDYQKHFLPPMRSKSPAMLPMRSLPARNTNTRGRNRIPREIRERSRRERDERIEADRFERAVAKRRWIYKHDLYAKHVASNGHTRYRPYPTPAQFSASQELISRATSFLRRELLVWPDMDIEFLTTFIISLMKAIDIRSESAVKLLAEFLDMDAPYVEGRRHVNAEHFAHEVYSYVRSPYKDLFVYDSVVQYDDPSTESPPRRRQQHSSRWREPSLSPSPSPSSSSPLPEPPRSRLRSRSRPGSRLPSSLYHSPPPPDRSPGREIRRSGARSVSSPRSRSGSWSPSGRTYPSLRQRERDLNRSLSPQGEKSQERRRSTETSLRRRHRHRSPEHDDVLSHSGYRHKPRDAGASLRDDSRRSSSRQLSVRSKGKRRARSDDEVFEGDAASVSWGPSDPAPSSGSPLALAKDITTDLRDDFISEMNSHVSPTMSGIAVTRPTQSDNKHEPSRKVTVVDSEGRQATLDHNDAPRISKPSSSAGLTRSRNRTLLDSVQAHLNLNAPKGLALKSVSGTKHSSQPSGSSKPVSTPSTSDVQRPSLLLRLSDVRTGEDGNFVDTQGATDDSSKISIANSHPPVHPQRTEEQMVPESRPPPPTTLAPAISPSGSSTSMVAIDTITTTLSAKPDAAPGPNVHDRLGQLKQQIRMNRPSAPIVSNSIPPPKSNDVDSFRSGPHRATVSDMNVTAYSNHEVADGTSHAHDAFHIERSLNRNRDPSNRVADRITKSSSLDMDIDVSIDSGVDNTYDIPDTSIPTNAPSGRDASNSSAWARDTVDSSRNMLLRRLEEEKRKIIQSRFETRGDVSHGRADTHTGVNSGSGGAGPVGLGLNTNNALNITSVSGTSSFPSLDSNTLEMEAKLRMRARLKVRLASEKRGGASGG